MRTIITTISLVILSFFSFAQEIDLGTNITPPSPNASAIAQYAAIPVSKSTGTMSINIPLFSGASTHLSMPISLSYHGGGIKVLQEASTVGLGWSLDAGGVITRTALGRYDEHPYDGYANLPELDLSDAQTRMDIFLNDYDLEPDVYHFNFNGLTGKFFKTKQDSIIQYDDSRIIIERISDDEWKVTDTQGIIYKFYDYETTFIDDTGDQYNSAWYLSKIIHPSGDNITLKYDISSTITNVSSSYSKFIGTMGGCSNNAIPCATPAAMSGGMSTTTITTKYLTEIITRTEKYSVNYNTRSDIPNSWLIESITKKTLSNQSLKTFSLGHDYFNTEEANGKKLKLIDVTESNGSIIMPPFLFEYNDLNALASRFTHSIDHWGFENNNSHQSPISFPLTTADILEFGNKYRKADNSSLKGLISKITYPTGLEKTFEFENHRYGAIEAPQISIPILALNNEYFSISQQNPVDDALFTTAPGYTDVSVALSNVSCPILGDCGSNFIEIVDINSNTVVQNWILQDFIGSATDLTNQTFVQLVSIPQGDYKVQVVQEVPGAIQEEFFNLNLEYLGLNQNPILSDYPIAGGVRIKSITDPEGTRVFDYRLRKESVVNGSVILEEKPSGILIDRPVYKSFNVVRCDKCEAIVYQPCYGYTLSSKSNGNLLSGAHVFYPSVKETLKDNSSIVSLYDFYVDGAINQSPITPRTNNQDRRSQLLTEWNFDANGDLKSKTKNTYSTLELGSYEVTTLAYSSVECAGEYSFSSYFHPSIKKQLLSNSVRTYDQYGVDFVETTTNHSYDSDYNLTSQVTSTNSESTTKTIKYAKQVYSGPHFLKDYNMISIPLEIEVDGVLGTKTEYKSLNGVNPFKQYIKVTGTDYKSSTEDLPSWKLMVEIKSFVNGLPKEMSKRGVTHNQVIDWLNGDNFGQIDKVMQGSRIIDYGYNSKRQLISMTNFNGLTNTYSYDDLSRLKTIDEYGKTLSSIDYFYEAVNGGDNKVTSSILYTDGSPTKNSETIYDVFGRDVQNILKQWTPEGNDMIISKVYNISGQITDNCDPRNGSCQTATYESIPGGRTLTSGYSGWDAEVVNQHLVNTASISSNGINYAPGSLTLLITTDENGNISKSYTNMFGKPVKTVKIIENDVEVVTSYTYNAKQNMTSLVNPNNDTYSYQFYDDGLLKSKTIPQGGTTSYTYDEAGQIITSNLPNGDILSNTYDDYNQLDLVSLNGVLIKDINYYTSGVANGQMQSEKNHLLDDMTAFITRNYSYDNYGRVNSITTIGIDGLSSEVLTDLDHRDLVETTQLEVLKNGVLDQTAISDFVYDNQDRLFTEHMTINTGNQELISMNDYFEQGWLKETNIGGGCLQSIDYLYNERGWITNINEKLVQEDDPISTMMQQDFGDAGGSLITEVNIKMNTLDIANGKPSSILVESNYTKIDFDSGIQEVASMKNQYMIHGAAINNQYSDVIQFTIQGFYDRSTYVQTIQNKIKQEVIPINPNFDTEVLNPIDEEVLDVFPDPSCPGCPEDVECSEDLFYQGLFYDQANAALNADAQMNGNIAWMNWKVPGTSENVQAVTPSAYGFTYDKLNRVTNAKYNKVNQFDVVIAYDDHIGNIDSLSRFGYNSQLNHYELIDQLDYSYTNGLLSSVADYANQDEGAKTSEYVHNPTTGNLESSADILSIEYNYLNLPNVVYLKNKVKIYYSYDADGTLWKRQVSDKSNPRTYHYMNGVSYENMDLEYIGTSNGQYISTTEETVNGTETVEGYQYVINDHLGNGRVWFMDRDDSGSIERDEVTNEVTQVQHYYPFGMSMNAPQEVNPIDPENRFKYNGKELEDDWGMYNYGARFYDPAIGRFTTTDRFAEKYVDLTPYHYGANNPINTIDINGDSIIVLSASESVSGLGHAAVLIGNDDKGWKLYSDNGTTVGIGSSGPSDDEPQNGVGYKTLEDFGNDPRNQNDDGSPVYTEGYLIPSDSETDAKMEKAASEEINEYYNVVSDNCIDVCSSALEAGGFDGGGRKSQYMSASSGIVSSYEVRNPIPNLRYKKIKKNNKGTVLNQGEINPK